MVTDWVFPNTLVTHLNKNKFESFDPLCWWRVSVKNLWKKMYIPPEGGVCLGKYRCWPQYYSRMVTPYVWSNCVRFLVQRLLCLWPSLCFVDYQGWILNFCPCCRTISPFDFKLKKCLVTIFMFHELWWSLIARYTFSPLLIRQRPKMAQTTNALTRKPCKV